MCVMTFVPRTPQIHWGGALNQEVQVIVTGGLGRGGGHGVVTAEFHLRQNAPRKITETVVPCSFSIASFIYDTGLYRNTFALLKTFAAALVSRGQS